jgi:dCTP deaminase
VNEVALLSDRRILEEMEKGRIVIVPYNERNLGTNSYDVRVGNAYFKENRAISDVYLDSEEEVAQLWDGPYWSERYIPIGPYETILAHTVECIGGRNGITAEMKSRSTIARCRLSVCRCAGLGDVGYVNRWTMEITNHGRTRLWVYPGMRVAQICFHDVGPTKKDYHGKYGQGEWRPEDMLPKPYLDLY